MEVKKIMTYQDDIKRVRLLRIIWKNQRRCLTIGLEPKLLKFKELGDHPYNAYCTVLGVRFHFKRAGGGLFV